MLIKLYSKQRTDLFVFCTVSVIRCMSCYPTTIDKDLLFWLFAVTSKKVKMFPLKRDFLSLGVYYISISSYKGCYSTNIGNDILMYFSGWFYPPQRERFLYFSTKCRQTYGLLPHHYWRGCFALVISSVTSNEAKMLPLIMDPQV